MDVVDSAFDSIEGTVDGMTITVRPFQLDQNGEAKLTVCISKHAIKPTSVVIQWEVHVPCRLGLFTREFGSLVKWGV